MPATVPATVPLWVPALLLALLALGYRLSRARTVRPSALAAISAAMFGFSLYGVVSAFGADAVTLGVWLLAYTGAAVGGALCISPAGMTKVGSHVRVPGSWWPMVLIMGIFTAKFALGYAASVHAAVLHNASFIVAMSAALGLLSGGFGARTLAVRRFVQSADRP
jgi:hypothetical protein